MNGTPFAYRILLSLVQHPNIFFMPMYDDSRNNREVVATERLQHIVCMDCFRFSTDGDVVTRPGSSWRNRVFPSSKTNEVGKACSSGVGVGRSRRVLARDGDTVHPHR